MKDIPHMLPLR
jgi:hypothetical protein